MLTEHFALFPLDSIAKSDGTLTETLTGKKMRKRTLKQRGKQQTVIEFD